MHCLEQPQVLPHATWSRIGGCSKAYLIPASASGHVQHSPVLGGVEVLATKHGVNLAAQVSSLSKLHKELQQYNTTVGFRHYCTSATSIPDAMAALYKVLPRCMLAAPGSAIPSELTTHYAMH
jgi:hypothetical protein